MQEIILKTYNLKEKYLTGSKDVSFDEPFSLLNPLSKNKISDVTKLKAFSDDKLNVSNMIIG